MRKAGELLKQLMGKAADIDSAYASRVRDLIPEKQVHARMLGGAALRDIQIPADLPKEYLSQARLGAGGVMASNAAVRYGLPTLGAVAAHRGLTDLYNIAAQTPVFGENPADVLDPNLLVTYVQ